MIAALAGRSAALHPLIYPAFRRVWLGTVFDGFGSWMERLAVGWFVLDATGSVFVAALSFAVRSAPNMVVGPFGGAIADRFERPRVLVATAATKAALLALAAALTLAGVTAAWPLLMLVALSSIARSSEIPATQALIADIVSVPRAAQAIALQTFGVRTVGVLGALVGGVLLDRIGAGLVLLTAAGAIGLASLTYSTLRIPRGVAAHSGRRSLWSETRDGLRQALRIPAVLRLLLLALGIEVFAFSYQALLPGVADRLLHVGATGLGALTLAAGIGGVVGTALLAQLAESVPRGRLLIAVLLVFGCGLVALAISERFLASLLVIAIVGGSAAMFDALQLALLQASVPDEIRGRVIGAWVAAIGFGWLGPVLLGLVAELLGVRWGIALGGAVALVLAGATVCSLHLRRL